VLDSNEPLFLGRASLLEGNASFFEDNERLFVGEASVLEDNASPALVRATFAFVRAPLVEIRA
jgi:hypothetical protein